MNDIKNRIEIHTTLFGCIKYKYTHKKMCKVLKTLKVMFSEASFNCDCYCCKSQPQWLLIQLNTSSAL